MPDIVDIIQKVGYALDIGYWLIELDSKTVYWPKGLGKPRDAAIEAGYQASSLDKVTAMIDEADRGRFRGFLTAILRGDADEQALEVGMTASWGGRIRVRLAGRKVGTGPEARIIGLVEVITHWKESERLAKSLAFIVEALFISSDSGIVIFDSDLAVRRLNRNALDLFGIADAEEAAGNYSAAIEERLPLKTRELLQEAIENSTAVTGTLSPNGFAGPRLTWRANPWGAGDGDTSGIVMVFNPMRLPRAADVVERESRPPVEPPKQARKAPEPAPLPPLPPDQRHRALEWVKTPVCLVSLSTGEIVFANRTGRDFCHLPQGKRCFVENLYDLSGFTCDPDPVVIHRAGAHLLRLKLGARVGRMFDYDEDLLFVEWHGDAAHPLAHPQAHTRPLPTPAHAPPRA